MVDEDGLGGVTSNPAIFEKAMGAGTDYDERDRRARPRGARAPRRSSIAWPIDDVRAACDVLAPVYLSSGGEDGFVSIEVSPAAAHDTQRSIDEAHRLFAAVDRPNVMVKIPGTKEGVPAIRAVPRGRPQHQHHAAVLDVAVRGGGRGLPRGARDRGCSATRRSAPSSSVASFFVSRVDTLVDKLLDERIAAAADAAERRRLEGLKGKAGVANSKLVYERFRSYLNGERLAAARGRRRQGAARALGEHRHQEPGLLRHALRRRAHRRAHRQHHAEATWKAFNDHGTLARTVDRHLDEAHRVLRELGQLGIDMEQVGAQLQDEGVDLFVKSLRRRRRHRRAEAAGDAGARKEG